MFEATFGFVGSMVYRSRSRVQWTSLSSSVSTQRPSIRVGGRLCDRRGETWPAGQSFYYAPAP